MSFFPQNLFTFFFLLVQQSKFDKQELYNGGNIIFSYNS